MDGTFYTWKLAVHYFRKQPETEDRDRCFVITGSMVAYIDSPVGRTTDYPGLWVDADSGEGQLGIHCNQTWSTRLHENSPPKQLGARHPN